MDTFIQNKKMERSEPEYEGLHQVVNSTELTLIKHCSFNLHS